jgi:K(+)-stimulated pyrophosphate-energized sodium pump
VDIQKLLYFIPIAGAIALLYAFITTRWIHKQEIGTDRMKKISEQIFKGAMAFLAAEYKVLSLFVVAVAVVLGLTANATSSHPLVALSFVLGATCSGLAGFFGMRVATRANVRTAAAARVGLAPALKIAFRGGAVMGMSVVGLALLGLGSLFIFYTGFFGVSVN